MCVYINIGNLHVITFLIVMPGFKCPLCSIAYPKRSAVLWHIKRDHKFEPFKMKCGIDGCPMVYSNVNGLSAHIVRKHQRTDQREENLTLVDTTDESGMMENDLSLSEDITVSNKELTISQESMQKASAMFILKMKELHRLPQKAIDSIIQGTKELYEDVFMKYQPETKAVLEAYGVNIINNPQIYQHLQNEVTDPFDGLKTAYSLIKYFKEKLSFEVSQIYICMLLKICK